MKNMRREIVVFAALALIVLVGFLVVKRYKAASLSLTTQEVSLAARPDTANQESTDTQSPTLTLTEPKDNAVITKRSALKLTATAKDNEEISRVDFFVDGTLICSDTLAGYECSWQVPDESQKTYSITAIAYDEAQNNNGQTIKVSTR